MKKRKNADNSNSSSTEKSPKKLKVNTSPSSSNTTDNESPQTPDTTPATPGSLNSIFDTPISSEIDYFMASNSPQAAILNNFNSINNTSSSNAALYPNLDDITIPSNTNQESICEKILNKIKSWYR